MNEYLSAVILGIIEGLTEFLPVSSTGHMILAMPLLGVDSAADPWPAFLYFIQIAAMLAVAVYFGRHLMRQVLTVPAAGLHQHILVKLFIGVFPAVVVGPLLNDWVEAKLEHPRPVAAALIVGAFVMIWIERRCRRHSTAKEMPIEAVTLRQAFLIGLAQCVSIIPGTSRAMATIMGGMLVGLPAARAAEFSFYLAIPTLAGAGMYRLLKDWDTLTAGGARLLLVGSVVSFLVAWAVVAAFMKYIQTRPLHPFAWYRIGLGVAVLLYFSI